MEGEEDWLFRPVFEGMYRAEQLLDCSIDLEFVALCNEAIDVKQENMARMAAAKE